MNGVNYTDLHKVYNPHLYESTPLEQNIVLEEEIEEEEFIEETFVEEEELVDFNRRPTLTISETRFNDPVRELAADFLPLAAAYAITNWLGAYSKGPNYVGNQHISSMSDERVAEYRRQGLLPPPA